MFRISVLVFILFSVNLFIKTTTKEEILSALLWLFLPLRIFNIDIERLSLRAVLTLEYIEDLSVRLSNYKQNKSLELSNKDAKTGYFSSEFYLKRKDHFLHLIEHSGIIFREILKEAEKTSGKSYTLDCLESPKFIQFSYPLGLFLIYFYSL
ncbi:MAG: hypothetical protein OQL19_02770 [Gammaproteobacteria bacterium]|nr:hypothetical protein [Gammaproteobacteria bacterium]